MLTSLTLTLFVVQGLEYDIQYYLDCASDDCHAVLVVQGKKRSSKCLEGACVCADPANRGSIRGNGLPTVGVAAGCACNMACLDDTAWCHVGPISVGRFSTLPALPCHVVRLPSASSQKYTLQLHYFF